MRGKKREMPPVEIRRRIAEPGEVPEAEAAAPDDDVEEHDGWQPVRPRRPSEPPAR